MLNRTALSLIVALLASGALTAPCAAGSIFNFQYSIPAPNASFDAVSAIGTLLADEVPSGYLVVGITGTRTVNDVPEAITGLIAPLGYAGNSNLFYYPNDPLLDVNGLSFTVAALETMDSATSTSSACPTTSASYTRRTGPLSDGEVSPQRLRPSHPPWGCWRSGG